MGTEIKYLRDEDIVLFRSSGIYEITDSILSVKGIINELNSHNCYRCVIDHRETNVIWNIIDTYNRPETYEKYGYKRQTKVALVFKGLSKETEFYENVCRNKGFTMRVFDDYNDAIDWLDNSAL